MRSDEVADNGGVDWQKEVEQAVAYVRDELPEVHRGAFDWHTPTNTVVIFNNRRLVAPAADLQREFVRLCLARFGVTDKAYAEDDKETWAMLVRGVPTSEALGIVWAAYVSARGQLRPDAPQLAVQEFMESKSAPLTPSDQWEFDVAKRVLAAQYSDPNKWKDHPPNAG